ncbi:hypothetical protein [Hymenobacter koreensis]|uniref:DUF4252 domain-containing protein n=1 Tax=Hymenobacter koreensis TaxID=1084523 RepID=A0ABP8J5Y4_9BACT
MRKLVLLAAILGFFSVTAAFGQNQAPALNFCGLDIPVSAGCTAASSYELRCTDYSLRWAYLNYAQMGAAAEEAARVVKKDHKKAEQEPLVGFILDMPAKGYRLSYPTEATGMAYEIILYGVAKGQPVVVQLTMGVAPEKTTDLPEVARRILRLDR